VRRFKTTDLTRRHTFSKPTFLGCFGDLVAKRLPASRNPVPKSKECDRIRAVSKVKAVKPAQDPLIERLENAESAGPLEDDVLAEIEAARAEIRHGDFVIDQRTVRPAV